MSELYGRKRVFQVSYTVFTLFQIGCALAKNIETLLVCRWLAGFFGSSVMSNSGAVGAWRHLLHSFLTILSY